MATTPKSFFVFGLQKSGTKYLRKLIEANTDLTFASDYAWKHTMKPEHVKNDDVVKFWITKSPYNWVRSVVYRHRVDILQKYKRYDLESTQTMQARRLNVKNLMLLYNDYHNAHDMQNVRYEELVDDCFMYFKRMSWAADHYVRVPPIQDISTPKFPLNEESRLEAISLPRKNDPLIVEINKYIDKDLMTRLNYEEVR